jgi:hypothetical protein
MIRHPVFSRASGVALLLSLSLVGCAGGPRPVEVTEPWTSGDERAVGIEEPASTSEAREGVSVSDAAAPPE